MGMGEMNGFERGSFPGRKTFRFICNTCKIRKMNADGNEKYGTTNATEFFLNYQSPGNEKTFSGNPSGDNAKHGNGRRLMGNAHNVLQRLLEAEERFSGC